MFIQEYSVGSILLETLISIVILGLIATGSFYSYSFVYQRIHSQRQQRLALGVLQGWMEETISSLLNESLNPAILRDINSKRIIEQYYITKFKAERSTMIDPNNNINPGIALIDPNISLEIIDDDNSDDRDNMIGIRISGALSNSEDLVSSKKDLKISLYTEINPK